MASPRFIGIRDVIDPYKGLQDSVSKVGDIYRQYDKDAQEAQRIRNEEARQNERLEMARATHNQQQEKYAEEQRRNEVIRGFDPEKQIENYGIPERFIPEINKPEQQVRDYYSRAPLIAAGNGAEGIQARQQVEESFPALRAQARSEAFDATTAQRQGIEYLTSQGVPVADAAAMVQARTLGQLSHTDKANALAAQAKAADDHALERAKIEKDILRSLISANKPSATNGTGSNNKGTGAFSEVTPVTAGAINKAIKDLTPVIGDGAFWWSGDATVVAGNVNASIREINTKRQAHNEQVALGKIVAPLMPLVSFEEGVNWLTETAEIGGNVEFTTPGSVKTFLEDKAAKRDFNTAVKLAEKGKGGLAAGGITGDDIKSVIPQRTAVPPIDDVIRSRVTASYAKLFPEVFPKPPSATTTTARPSNAPADGGASTGTNSERGDRGITPPPADGKLNITDGTLPVRDGSGTSKGSEQQAIPREVVVPYNESPTPEQKNINAVVSRMAEIQEILLDPNLSGDKRRDLFSESQITGDSIRRMPDGDRILETIVTNARQARMQNVQDQTKAGKEHSSRESIIKEVLQINERLAGNLSPEVRRINEERLKSLEKDFPSLGDSSSIGKEKFDNYISKLESQIRHRSAPGRVLGSSKTLSNLQQELNEAKRLAGYQKTDGDRVQTLAQLQEADVQKIAAKRATVESNISKIEQELQSLRPNIRMQDPASIQQGYKLGKELRDATQELFRLNMSAPKPNSNSRNIPIPEGNVVGKGTIPEGGLTPSNKVAVASPVSSDVRVMPPTKARPKDRTVMYDTNKGDPVKAVKRGQVISAQHTGQAGMSVVVRHDDGTLAAYTDFSGSPLVENGRRIDAGEVLMTAGGERDKTTFSVYDNKSVPINPSDWLKKNASSGK